MHETNVEFVKNLMEFSNCGVLVQTYVITALERYSELILADKDDFRQKLAEKGGYLDADTWIRCAEEVLRKIKGKYRAPEITCACGEQTTNPGFYNKCLGALLYAASGGTIDETPQGTK